jgi:hypothetical protein
MSQSRKFVLIVTMGGLLLIFLPNLIIWAATRLEINQVTLAYDEIKNHLGIDNLIMIYKAYAFLIALVMLFLNTTVHHRIFKQQNRRNH